MPAPIRTVVSTVAVPTRRSRWKAPVPPDTSGRCRTNERSCRREAPNREDRSTANGPQEIRGSSIGAHEAAIGRANRSSRFAACRVDEWSWPSPSLGRNVPGIESLDPLRPHCFPACRLDSRRSLRPCELEEVLEPAPALPLGQVRPSRQRRETDYLLRHKPLPAGAGLPPARKTLRRPVEPRSGERAPIEHRREAGRSGPLERVRNKALLDPLSKEVVHSLDLRGGLVAHQDRLVSPTPDLLSPSMQSPDLASEIRVEKADEAGELLGIAHPDQQVVVIREEDERDDRHLVSALSTAENAEGDFPQPGRRPQQEPRLNRAGGDLDEGTPRRNEPETSSHAP